MRALGTLLGVVGALLLIAGFFAALSTRLAAKPWLSAMQALGAKDSLVTRPQLSHALVVLVVGALVYALGLRLERKPPTRSTSHGSARFAQTAELRKFGYSEASVGMLIRLQFALGMRTVYPHVDGVVLCQEDSAVVDVVVKNGKVSLKCRREAPFVVVREHHVRVEAPPGGGKDVSLFVPSILYEINRSIVVLDPKGLIYEETAGSFGIRSAVSKALRFAPLEPDSLRIDVTGDIPVGKPGEIAVAKRIANALIVGLKSEKDNSAYYATSALPLATAAIVFAMNEFKGELRSLAGALAVLGDTAKSQTDILANLIAWLNSRPHGGSLAARLVRLSENKKTIPDAFQTCMNALEFCDIDEVRRSISPSTDGGPVFKPSDLSQGRCPVSLYLVIPFEDSQMLRPLTRLVVDMLLASHRLERTRDTAYYLNELPSVGPIPRLINAGAQLRQYGVQLVFGYQSEGQLVREYGKDDAQVILDICQASIILRVTGRIATANASEELGKATLVRPRETKAVSRRGVFEKTETTTTGEGEQARELMSADELRVLPPNECIVVLPYCRPYVGKRLVSYSQERLKRLRSIVAERRKRLAA